MSSMSSIRANNDLGHPICHNLRNGNWLMEYTAKRLMPFERTKKVCIYMYIFFLYIYIVFVFSGISFSYKHLLKH